MGILKHEMKPGVKCYVRGHAVSEDPTSPMIESKGVILAVPMLNTVLIELKTPPKGVTKQYHVPVDSVYWTSQK